MLSIISSFSILSSSLVFSMSIGGCTTLTGHEKEPMAASEVAQLGYNLDKPTIYELPKALKEISGIRFYHKDNSLIYAEQDEKGRIYWLVPGDSQVQYYDFGKDGDYEDLAFMKEQAVFLRSDGTLFSFGFTPGVNHQAPPATQPLKVWKDLLPKGEYEGMYADTSRSQLYILCKECKAEDHHKKVSIYRLDNNNQGFVMSRQITLDVGQIETVYNQQRSKKKKEKVNFKPSALCFNELTGEWFILSSINKMLVVAGPDMQVRAVYALDKKLYPQPEGICFDADNNLYISNEGPGGKKGTILKMAYQAK